MKKQELLKVKQLSGSIGQFIRYWGFRQIHGEIWALVYLSKKNLSGIEIGQILNVSKALISPALKELEAEGLIVKVKSENSKTKRYQAEEDVSQIIQGVLKRREIPMIYKIQKNYLMLKKMKNQNETFDTRRIEQMGAMIELAQFGLATLIDTEFSESP